jgi:hypothetical protein
MAKRPEDRFQTVGELTEELTAAAADKPATAAATTGPGSADRSTNRIIVPTGSNEAPRSTANEDHDEATVVRARPESSQVVEAEIFSTEVAPPPESFNPWRIVIPAVAGLLVIFAVVFALTRNSTSQPAANDNSQPLAVDPASQPVQPAQTPTGAGERDIAPSITPLTSPDGNVSTVPEPNLNKNQNAGVPDRNANENDNKEPGANSNAGETQPSPSPNKNANQRHEVPRANVNSSPDTTPDEPPPMTTPKPQQTPKPLPTPKPSSSGDGAPQPPGGQSGQSSNPLFL